MRRTIRISLDIPEDLHRRIDEAARGRGCSARAWILYSLERELALEFGPKGRVKAPLVTGQGEPVDPSREETSVDGLFC